MATVNGQEIFVYKDTDPAFDLKYVGFKTARGNPGSWRFHSFYTKGEYPPETGQE